MGSHNIYLINIIRYRFFINIHCKRNCNGTRTYNHLVRKRKLSHLAKWWCGYLSVWCTHCLFLSWSIYTQQLPQRQGTPCSEQALYLKFRWLQWDSFTNYDRTWRKKIKLLSWYMLANLAKIMYRVAIVFQTQNVALPEKLVLLQLFLCEKHITLELGMWTL